MNACSPRVLITTSAFWRLLPQGMRRRWWLFRLFDSLVRHWPVSRGRRGILVIRMDGIGDMTLFRNSLDHYANAFGIAANEITVLGCESWSSIASEVFDDYRVITINEHRYARHLGYRLKVNIRVRFFAPQITVSDAYFRRALMSDSLAWVAGAPRTVVALPYINERTRPEFAWYMSQGWEVIDTGAYPAHELVRHARFIEAVTGQSVLPEAPAITWRDRSPPAKITSPYVVLNPGSNEYGRRWPLTEYVALASWLRARDLRVVFVGKAEEKACDDLLAPLLEDEGIVDMIGQSTLPELFDIMSGADLVVSNDTGPAHVAIALGTKTVVIVGGGHFGCFVPYPDGVVPGHAKFVYRRMDCYHCFWRCHKRDDPKASFPCVAAVSIDQVRTACTALLDSVNTA